MFLYAVFFFISGIFFLGVPVATVYHEVFYLFSTRIPYAVFSSLLGNNKFCFSLTAESSEESSIRNLVGYITAGISST